jgi:hypothetical protein
MRTARGRVATHHAYRHFDVHMPEKLADYQELSSDSKLQ